MTLSCSSTDFENDSDFMPTLPDAASDSGYAVNALRIISLTDNVQFSFRRDS